MKNHNDIPGHTFATICLIARNGGTFVPTLCDAIASQLEYANDLRHASNLIELLDDLAPELAADYRRHLPA